MIRDLLLMMMQITTLFPLKNENIEISLRGSFVGKQYIFLSSHFYTM